MKLNDYFQTQKQTSLTDIDKLELYQKFLYKKNSKPSPVRRFSFVHAKAFVYTLVIAFLVVGLYGVYFMNDDSGRFMSNTVQADYIAKVVSFNGDFSIEHEGRLLQTKNIGNGDTIILKQGSEMVFEINSGTKSKIIGPAKLTIQKVDGNNTKYKLNLIYGDYIQMEGTKISQNVELAIDDILIKQADHATPINYQFINEGQGHILKNNGASLTITKNGDIKTTQIGQKQVLAIKDNDITLFKNRDSFAKAVKKGEVTQTFALNDTKYQDIKTTISNPTTGNEEETPVSLMSLLYPETTTDTTDITTEDTASISKDINTLLGNEKQIPTDAQLSAIRGSLGSTFLMETVKTAYTNQTLAPIDKVINQIYAGLNTSYEGSANLTDKISKLISILNTKYEINPKYINNLKITLNWISTITNTQASKTQTSRETFQTTLPSNLLFQ